MNFPIIMVYLDEFSFQRTKFCKLISLCPIHLYIVLKQMHVTLYLICYIILSHLMQFSTILLSVLQHSHVLFYLIFDIYSYFLQKFLANHFLIVKHIHILFHLIFLINSNIIQNDVKNSSFEFTEQTHKQNVLIRAVSKVKSHIKIKE